LTASSCRRTENLTSEVVPDLWDEAARRADLVAKVLARVVIARS